MTNTLKGQWKKVGSHYCSVHRCPLSDPVNLSLHNKIFSLLLKLL